MDPALQQALDMLDKAAAIIQELVAQVQSKPQQEDMSKKAESIAAKTGMSFNAANDMIKQASENGTSVEAILKAADLFTNKFSFGKVASTETELSKTGSIAMDKYQERELALMDELGF